MGNASDGMSENVTAPAQTEIFKGFVLFGKEHELAVVLRGMCSTGLQG
jgi:hypothetical protein